jgi:hypothetical protein
MSCAHVCLSLSTQLLSLYFASYYFAAMGGAMSMELDMGQSVYESFGKNSSYDQGGGHCSSLFNVYVYVMVIYDERTRYGC